MLDRLSEHNLLLVLQGHLHVDELLRWCGTTFITGGAVCGKWWRGARLREMAERECREALPRAGVGIHSRP